MDKFDIKPKFVNPYTTISGITVLAVTLFFGIFLLPKSLRFYLEFPQEITAKYILISVAAVFIIVWIYFILALKISLGRKITIDKNLVYFMKREKLGFGKWIIDKVIDFSKIVKISERKKGTYVSTGRGIIPIVYYWIIFEDKTGVRQEILLNNGWNVKDIQNLFYFLKGKFPQIEFNLSVILI